MLHTLHCKKKKIMRFNNILEREKLLKYLGGNENLTLRSHIMSVQNEDIRDFSKLNKVPLIPPIKPPEKIEVKKEVINDEVQQDIKSEVKIEIEEDNIQQINDEIKVENIYEDVNDLICEIKEEPMYEVVEENLQYENANNGGSVGFYNEWQDKNENEFETIEENEFETLEGNEFETSEDNRRSQCIELLRKSVFKNTKKKDNTYKMPLTVDIGSKQEMNNSGEQRTVPRLVFKINRKLEKIEIPQTHLNEYNNIHNAKAMVPRTYPNFNTQTPMNKERAARDRIAKSFFEMTLLFSHLRNSKRYPSKNNILLSAINECASLKNIEEELVHEKNELLEANEKLKERICEINRSGDLKKSEDIE